MALDWARAAQGCQLHHQSCNLLDPRGKAEAWLIEDNPVKNCGSGTEEHEAQLGHHPEAGHDKQGWRSFLAALYSSLHDGSNE